MACPREYLSSSHSTERGASPQVGFILLIGLVMVSGTLVFVVGMGALDSIQRQAMNERETQVLQQFDHDLASLTNDTAKSVYLEQGKYNISNTSTIRITSSNGFEEISNHSVTMGTLIQNGKSSTELGYQAGGIWRNNGGSTTIVSRPDLRYYKEESDLGRIDFSITSLSGNAGPGENTVIQYNSSRPSIDTPTGDEFVSHVEITVEGTRYHDGWYEFMSDEFKATDIEAVDSVDEDKYPSCDFEPDRSYPNLICHDPDNQTVTVIATIDGNNPFAHHVGIDPTIYGGLSADSIEGDLSADNLNVTGYSSKDTNTSPDIFTVNSRVDLEEGADIDAYPVLNGELDPEAGSTVDPIAYVSDPNFETRDANRRYWTNGTRVAHLTDDVIAANMSRPFDPHENIDTEIEDSALDYLKNNVGTERVEKVDGNNIGEAGRYYTSASEFDLNHVDTSSGSVHIGVGGSSELTLSDLTVTGGNQTYIYTNNSVAIGEDGVSTGGTAESFWLYGTSNTDITVNKNANFEGVIYAPESELEIEEGTEIFGAVVGGETEIGDDVIIKFDRSIRTDIPIPEENRDITVEEARAPLDVTFVLDGSGSMGGSASTVTGGDWQSPPFDSGMVASGANHSVEVNQCDFFGCSIETIDPGESYSDSLFQDTEEVRVKDGSASDSVIVKDPSRGFGSDPLALRADATRDFIEALNESNNDRAGVFEFNSGSETVRELDSDLSSVRNSISVSANGGTDMSKGMGAALSQYSDSSDNKRVMVLLSDGKNDLRTDDRTERANDMTKQLINESASESVTIYTIGLGNDVDTTLLKKAANKTDGKYYHADDAEKLEDLFDRIAERAIADAEITFDVGGIPDPGEASSDYVINVETRQVRIEN